MKLKYEEIQWVSASEIIEAQTRALSRTFHCSKPKPRNRAMGFKGEEPRRRMPIDYNGTVNQNS